MRSVLSFLSVLLIWQIVCILFSVPAWFLPTPSAVAVALWTDGAVLFHSLVFTAKVTTLAFFLACLFGVVVGFFSYISKNVREGLLPFTILLQTTPVVSIAPLLIVWFRNNAFAALVACAWLVCVYPMISATVSGFRATDANLRRLFRLYRISPWKSLWHLELPSALPFILNGVRVAGGLALVGAIGAEFVAGTGGQELGLAYRLLMAAYNQETARLFAALSVVSLYGVSIHFSLEWLEKWAARRWRVKTASATDV
ncbi:MAG: hypothetical protein RIR26_552 [Pseudomonadota bacterium]|jgi:NitT/TauT family transport system permease protein